MKIFYSYNYYTERELSLTQTFSHFIKIFPIHNFIIARDIQSDVRYIH